MTETNHNQSTPAFLTPTEVAEHLQISLNAVYNLIHRGALRAADLSRAGQAGGRGLYRIKPRWVEEFLEGRVAQPPVAVPRRSHRRRTLGPVPPNYTGL
jgi:excisionase family DNA binding protein